LSCRMEARVSAGPFRGDGFAAHPQALVNTHTCAVEQILVVLAHLTRVGGAGAPAALAARSVPAFAASAVGRVAPEALAVLAEERRRTFAFVLAYEVGRKPRWAVAVIETPPLVEDLAVSAGRALLVLLPFGLPDGTREGRVWERAFSYVAAEALAAVRRGAFAVALCARALLVCGPAARELHLAHAVNQKRCLVALPADVFAGHHDAGLATAERRGRFAQRGDTGNGAKIVSDSRVVDGRSRCHSRCCCRAFGENRRSRAHTTHHWAILPDKIESALMCIKHAATFRVFEQPFAIRV